MKVIHVFKITGVSGSENHLLTLLPALKNKGLDIIVIMMENPKLSIGDFYQKLKSVGIKVYRVKIKFNLSITVFRKIKNILKTENPDIVHTHLIHGDLYGILTAKSSGVKNIISSKHNDDDFRNKFHIKYLNKFLNKRLSKVIVISEALKKFSIEIEKIRIDKIVTIRYGLDNFELRLKNENLREHLGYRDDEYIFGIIARLTEQKGHIYLLEAFKNIVKKHKKARLLIVGDGVLRKQLETIVKDDNIENFVQFLGRREDTADIYNAIDAFIHPSLWEGFGLVFLEAMSFALPVIATNVSAIPEVVEKNRTGLLVKPKNSEELFVAMEKFINDKDMAKKYGKMGKIRVKDKFNVETMVERTKEVYLKVLNG